MLEMAAAHEHRGIGNVLLEQLVLFFAVFALVTGDEQ
jgi:hypothetical protein